VNTPISVRNEVCLSGTLYARFWQPQSAVLGGAHSPRLLALSLCNDGSSTGSAGRAILVRLRRSFPGIYSACGATTQRWHGFVCVRGDDPAMSRLCQACDRCVAPDEPCGPCHKPRSGVGGESFQWLDSACHSRLACCVCPVWRSWWSWGHVSPPGAEFCGRGACFAPWCRVLVVEGACFAPGAEFCGLRLCECVPRARGGLTRGAGPGFSRAAGLFACALSSSL